SCEEAGKADIIVNATPAGMGKDVQHPIDPTWLKPHQYVYDTVYIPSETPLLKAAREAGCATRGGLGMLVRQGAASFKIWTGKEPGVDRMTATLNKLLAR